MSKNLFTVLLLLGTTTLILTQVQQLSKAAALPLSLEAKDFTDFKMKFGKKYTKPGEEAYRKTIFLQNKAKVDAHNKNASKTYTAGINQFSDLTPAEFAATYLTLKVSNIPLKGKTVIVKFVLEKPNGRVSAIDWVALGKVTSVKNQGNCGSSWAFSAIANLESSVAVAKGMVGSDFSEQELIDCSANQGNSGCNGGQLKNAFKYMKANGISSETFYPYVGVTSTCKKRCLDILDLIYLRPVSVAVDATNWGSYKSGIFNNCGNSTVNHGGLVVGITAAGEWKIKNSWGTQWGERGYIRLASGNTCNVCTYPYVSFISS